MFVYRDSRQGEVSRFKVDVAFTDATVDLAEQSSGLRPTLGQVEEQTGVQFARLNQVHGDEVLVSSSPTGRTVPEADGLVSVTRGLGLMVRVADCVPVLLADVESGVVGAVHAGRAGMALGIVDRAIATMRQHGAQELTGWIGPHVCRSCYEVPAQMRADVAAAVPESYSETTWGTPSLDIGAGVRTQLLAAGVQVIEVDRCTREDTSLHSYRRDGEGSGRLAGLVWLT